MAHDGPNGHGPHKDFPPATQSIHLLGKTHRRRITLRRVEELAFTEKKKKNQMMGGNFLFYKMEGVISLRQKENTITRRARKVR